jgi:hypothetical protein
MAGARVLRAPAVCCFHGCFHECRRRGLTDQLLTPRCLIKFRNKNLGIGSATDHPHAEPRCSGGGERVRRAQV